MTGRVSGLKTVTQLLGQTARRTSDTQTKMKILAVKAANYSLKSETQQIEQTGSGKKDFLKAQDKTQRLTQALMNYSNLRAEDASTVALQMVKEAREVIANHEEDIPFQSRVLMVEDYKNAQTFFDANHAFIGIVENTDLDADTLKNIFTQGLLGQEPEFITHVVDNLAAFANNNALSPDYENVIDNLIFKLNQYQLTLIPESEILPDPVAPSADRSSSPHYFRGPRFIPTDSDIDDLPPQGAPSSINFGENDDNLDAGELLQQTARGFEQNLINLNDANEVEIASNRVQLAQAIMNSIESKQDMLRELAELQDAPRAFIPHVIRQATLFSYIARGEGNMEKYNIYSELVASLKAQGHSG